MSQQSKCQRGMEFDSSNWTSYQYCSTPLVNGDQHNVTWRDPTVLKLGSAWGADGNGEWERRGVHVWRGWFCWAAVFCHRTQSTWRARGSPPNVCLRFLQNIKCNSSQPLPISPPLAPIIISWSSGTLILDKLHTDRIWIASQIYIKLHKTATILSLFHVPKAALLVFHLG
jgi:hypothetical protein